MLSSQRLAANTIPVFSSKTQIPTFFLKLSKKAFPFLNFLKLKVDY